MNELNLAEVRQFLRRFAAERDWEQFHTPKNLAMALAAEAGELLEVFQWLTPEESVSPTTFNSGPPLMRSPTSCNTWYGLPMCFPSM